MDTRAFPLPSSAPLSSPTAPTAADRAARIDGVATEFEAVFLSQIVRGMSTGLGPDGLFGKEPFGSLLADEYARLLARAGGIGIADATRRELLRLQEADR